MPAHKSGKKGRKIGRNKKDCERYQKEGRQERNKLIKAARHSKRHPKDTAQKSPVNYTSKAPAGRFDHLERYFDKNKKYFQ